MWIALSDRKTRRRQLVLLKLSDSTQRIVLLSPAWDIAELAWAADGHSLFALGVSALSNVILRVGLNGDVHVLLDIGKDHAVYSLHASPDGRRLAFGQATWESNAWLLQNF
jgi:hypothetical protein